MGRAKMDVDKKQSHNVNVRMTTEMLAWIVCKASDNDRTVSGEVRNIVKNAQNNENNSVASE